MAQSSAPSLAAAAAAALEEATRELYAWLAKWYYNELKR